MFSALRGTAATESACKRRLRSLAAAACLPLFLCACASFKIHDEGRAKLAAEAKSSYAEVKVPEVVEADRQNLERLLAEEIRVVRDNFALQVDFATLEIAGNTSPMGATYDEATARLVQLGLASPAQARALIHREIQARRHEQVLEVRLKAFRAVNFEPQPCAAQPVPLEIPPSLNEVARDRLTRLYADYQKFCAQAGVAPHPMDGLLGRAYGDWTTAKASLDERNAQQAAAARTMRTAKEAYDRAVQAAASADKKGEELSQALAAYAKTLAGALETVKKLDLEDDSEMRIESLIELLTAAAGGEVDPQNPRVARAALVAKQIPSLAGDIADLQAQGTRPPVSGLLVALRHRTILAEDARKRVALAEERVNILKARYDAYRLETERWLRFTDAVCSYAARTAGEKEHPGEACDRFAVDRTGVCSIADRPLPACGLEAAWKDALRGSQVPQGKRELYKAVTNYLQALALQARPLEETFREIDVRHRETLLAKKSALESWDNLVGVPVDQINSYYQGGIKPAEIADLIVKALGFTAIAIGAAQ